MIKHISTDSELAEDKRTPLPELSGTNRIDTISDTDNSVEIIEHCLIVFPSAAVAEFFSATESLTSSPDANMFLSAD